MRQEGRGGMLIGTYERAGVPWSVAATPREFGHELLETDLERVAPSLEVGFEHSRARARRDPARRQRPLHLHAGRQPARRAGAWPQELLGRLRRDGRLVQGGGVGLSLSNWMIQGDPGADIWGMDVARYGDWTTMAYTDAKVRENYSRRFRVRFPGEELPAGRRSGPRRSTVRSTGKAPCSARPTNSNTRCGMRPMVKSAASTGASAATTPSRRSRASAGPCARASG